MNSVIEKTVRIEWLELSVRWILGSVFVAASYYKIVSPEVFAKAVYSYDLFPHDLINLIAIILPYMECFSGLCLILGIYQRGAVLLISAMLIGFMIILSINLVRGHEFDCGCFSFSGYEDTDSVPNLLIRNGILLLLGSFLMYYRGHRKWCIQ